MSKATLLSIALTAVQAAVAMAALAICYRGVSLALHWFWTLASFGALRVGIRLMALEGA